jgi:hypothetical protein
MLKKFELMQEPEAFANESNIKVTALISQPERLRRVVESCLDKL